jgi:hypothetical protein
LRSERSIKDLQNHFFSQKVDEDSTFWCQKSESSLTDAHQTPLASVTLTESMHLVILNDENTMHEVTPVFPVDPQAPAYRDVLVIAFTKVFHD